MDGRGQLTDPLGRVDDEPGRIDVMGVSFDAFTPDRLIDFLIESSEMGRGGYVLTQNVDGLRQAVTDPSGIPQHIAEADVRVADGMPIVWASRVRRTPLPERVAGSDLIFTLSNALAERRRTLFLLGGHAGTASATSRILTDRFEGLEVVGTHCPPLGYEDDPAQLSRIESFLETTAPDFVYIGLPFDKAAVLAYRLRERLPSAWFLGLGVSFSFVSGDVQRAPLWLQRLGLEWLHRFAQEPRRLFRRYFIDDLPFVVSLMRWSLAARSGRLGPV